MSRSIKKRMGSTICCCKNIKDDRRIYHRAERAKAKRIIKDIVLDCEDDEASDSLIKNRVDYGVKWSDPWSWTSDGGSVLWETEESLKNDYIQITSEPLLWEDYLIWKETQSTWRWHSFRHSYLKSIIFKFAPEFKDEDTMFRWLRTNEKYILSVYKKINYGK